MYIFCYSSCVQKLDISQINNDQYAYIKASARVQIQLVMHFYSITQDIQDVDQEVQVDQEMHVDHDTNDVDCDWESGCDTQIDIESETDDETDSDHEIDYDHKIDHDTNVETDVDHETPEKVYMDHDDPVAIPLSCMNQESNIVQENEDALAEM